MKNINYYGQQVTVSDEVAEFLEQDRRREAAQERSDQRHLDYVGVDIASVSDLFTNAHSDPTFEKAYRNLRLEALRKAYQTLSDDERKLLCLHYYHEFSMEKIGRRLGVTKMAISKRLRKILDHLRSLMEDEAPYFSQIFLETRFTNLLQVSYKVNPKQRKVLRSHPFTFRSHPALEKFGLFCYNSTTYIVPLAHISKHHNIAHT